MPNPKVSVVIPSYNRAHLIGESIQSVLDQTYQDFELIVVDDGSSDNTEDVVRGFNDSRISYTYQDNKGISAARNAGIRKARGRYFAFLDSDDFWFRELLDLEVPILEENPNVGLVYAKAQAIDVDGELKGQISGALQKYPGQTLKSALYGNFVCIQTAIMRRECFDRVGLFDETLKARVDYDLWIRMAKHYHFAYLNKVLAHFRIHTGGYTHSKSEHFADVCAGRIRVLDKAFSDPDLSHEIRAVEPLAYRNAYLDIALGWLSAGNWRQSAIYFWKAIRTSPNPVVTLFRILWLILFYNFLSKTKWGNRLISRLVDLRRRWRAAPVV